MTNAAKNNKEKARISIPSDIDTRVDVDAVYKTHLDGFDGCDGWGSRDYYIPEMTGSTSIDESELDSLLADWGYTRPSRRGRPARPTPEVLERIFEFPGEQAQVA